MNDLLKKLSGLDENDLGNAERFIERCGGDVLYIAELGWHVWDGRRWKADPSEKYVRRLAHKTAKAIFEEIALADDGVKRTRFALLSGQSPRLTAMLKEAAPNLERTVEDLDRDPWLLNVQNGTLELNSGTGTSGDAEGLACGMAMRTDEPVAPSSLF